MDIDEFFETKRIHYGYYGKLSEIDFLKRIYDLEALPSYDSRFENAAGDIWQHTINNDDYEDGWIFEDDRFGLLNGDDEVLLKFLCSVFHPAVRTENSYWKEFLNAVNALLHNDGYELYPERKISGRDVFGWRKYNPEDNALFIPFSQRNAEDIKSKHLTLTISRKTRSQISALLDKFNAVFQEADESGWQYNITTNEYVFRDLSQFYKPMCYDENGKYVETSDMKQFILKSSPFSVLDAIELFEKYCPDGTFAAQTNSLLKLNSIAYKLEMGQIKSLLDVSIDKEDISTISEKGLRELVFDAERYYHEGNKQVAVEKLWDAFERLKTYYSPALQKKESANKIIDDMSASDSHFKKMYETEFLALTTIGNDYRIRHHETTKIDITDNRQYDYFYRRCLALISVAILYLEGGSST